MKRFLMEFIGVDGNGNAVDVTFEAEVNSKGQGFLLTLPAGEVTLTYNDTAAFTNALQQLWTTNPPKDAQARVKSKADPKRASRKK